MHQLLEVTMAPTRVLFSHVCSGPLCYWAPVNPFLHLTHSVHFIVFEMSWILVSLWGNGSQDLRNVQ